ncbi:Ger(x)C family spore germination protein [Thalassorhabdus alkalitolerans]|uniref:Ger(X)C family spore germination protein n=1 Tax=Thalassorhabdus alkalitolerans TaxID=2282697 RepID=A0ABW0YGL6_9BACI
MRNRIFFLIFLLLMVASGCEDERILEELGVIHTIGYDINDGEEEEKLRVTMKLPKAGELEGAESETLTMEAASSRDARHQLSRQTSRELVGGQMRVALFGLNMAEEGVWETLDTLVRDPTISKRVKVIVTQGTAHELIVTDFPEHERTDYYLDGIIEKETRSFTIPPVNLYSFARDLINDGVEPVATLVKVGENEIIMDGTALFKGDQYVSKINPKKSNIFFFLRDGARIGEINVNLSSEGEEQENIVLTAITSDRNIEVNVSDPEHIKVNYKADVKGSLHEYQGEMDIYSPEAQKELEQTLAVYIENMVEEIAQELQELRVDSLGVGKHVKKKLGTFEWSEEKWRDEMFPAVDITADVDVTIKDTGLFKTGPGNLK